MHCHCRQAITFYGAQWAFVQNKRRLLRPWVLPNKRTYSFVFMEIQRVFFLWQTLAGCRIFLNDSRSLFAAKYDRSDTQTIQVNIIQFFFFATEKLASLASTWFTRKFTEFTFLCKNKKKFRESFRSMILLQLIDEWRQTGNHYLIESLNHDMTIDAMW